MIGCWGYCFILFSIICLLNKAKRASSLALNSSENACRRIALLGQVPPFPPLSFVVHSREKDKVGPEILSENLFERKCWEKRCQT